MQTVCAAGKMSMRLLHLHKKLSYYEEKSNNDKEFKYDSDDDKIPVYTMILYYTTIIEEEPVLPSYKEVVTTFSMNSLVIDPTDIFIDIMDLSANVSTKFSIF